MTTWTERQRIRHEEVLLASVGSHGTYGEIDRRTPLLTRGEFESALRRLIASGAVVRDDNGVYMANRPGHTCVRREHERIETRCADCGRNFGVALPATFHGQTTLCHQCNKGDKR